MPDDETRDDARDDLLDEVTDELDDPEHLEHARLRISRDATADDLSLFLPDMPDDERAAWLERVREQGAEITFSVVTERHASELAGLIVSPPGSRDMIRRPDSAAADVERVAGAAVQESLDRRSL